MKRKVLSTRDVTSRGGVSRELTLECGHVLWRPGSWQVPMRADCPRCTVLLRNPAPSPDAAA